MASTLQKLLRKSPSPRIIAALHNKPAPNPLATFDWQQPDGEEKKPEGYWINNLRSLLTSPTIETSNPSQFSRIYPTFPFGIYLAPISSTGPILSEAEDMGFDGSRGMWADSVKKKRKRKMNKHKYKKLRKRLRRQT